MHNIFEQMEIEKLEIKDISMKKKILHIENCDEI